MTTVNTARGEAVIRLGSKDYVMAATYKAICAIESATGRGIIELSAMLSRGHVRLGDLVQIIYHAIDAEAYELSVDQIGDLVCADGLTTHMEPLISFFAVALTGGADSKKKPIAAGKK